MQKNIITILKEKKKMIKLLMAAIVGTITVFAGFALCGVSAMKIAEDPDTSTEVEAIKEDSAENPSTSTKKEEVFADGKLVDKQETHDIAAASNEARKIETTKDADEFISTFLGEHPEELDGIWALDSNFEIVISQMGKLNGLATQLASYGTIEKIDPAYEVKCEGYKKFRIPCAFSIKSVDIILTIQNGALAGLHICGYSGTTEATPKIAETDKSTVFDSIDLDLPIPSLGETYKLPGILTVPKGKGPFPVIVLIHGSGSHDKDETINLIENSEGLKPFRDIAEGLAEQGIAVYRFDKRTYVYRVESASNKQCTLMDESIEDAVNAVQLLTTQERIDPDRVLVLGHSLGGYAIPAIAQELEKAKINFCGFVMMAANFRPLHELMREQFKFLMPEETEEQSATKNALLEELNRLQEVDTLKESDIIMKCWVSYWKWLARYDVLKAAMEIEKPVLLLQGEEDYQVTMEDFELWQKALAGKTNCTLKSYPGLTHLFMAGLKAAGPDAYVISEHRDEKVNAQVILDIATFVKGLK